MKVEDAADLALGTALGEVAGIPSKAALAEAVQVFLRELAGKVGFPWNAAVRTVHGIITKWRKAQGI